MASNQKGWVTGRTEPSFLLHWVQQILISMKCVGLRHHNFILCDELFEETSSECLNIQSFYHS